MFFISGVVAASLSENAYKCLYSNKNKSESARQPSIYLVFTLRVLPDLLVGSIIVVMFASGTHTSEFTKFLRYIMIPHFFMLSIALVSIQSETVNVRSSLWRYICESRLMNLIGYCSYSMYLLQQVMLNYYARVIYDDIQNDTFPIIQGGTDPNNYDVYSNNGWFSDKAWWWKPIGFFCLLAFCWPIQRYFQDTFVLRLYSNYMIKI